MTRELENIIYELKQYLYQNNNEIEKIDKINLQKALFKLLRESLKEQKYEIEVGSYLINVNPQELSVKYESNNTVVEVSNNDVYYESIRDIPITFYLLTDDIKQKYDLNYKVIKVSGIVTNIDGIAEEHYTFELYTESEESIEKYINLAGKFMKEETEENSESLMSISRPINKAGKRTDVKELITVPSVKVIFDINNEKYTADQRISNDEDYSLLLPSLAEKKNIVSYIYSSMVEFYTKYI